MQQGNPTFAEIVIDRPVERFLHRFILSTKPIDELILVSPYIGPLWGVSVTLQRIVEKINAEHIRTYVVTNSPAADKPAHSAAVAILSKSRWTEVRYNESLHAKVYVCHAPSGGFALFGSGNLTESSINHRLEVGMIINERGQGVPLYKTLHEWSLIKLRTLEGTKVVKSRGGK